jgi:hypothetical protein
MRLRASLALAVLLGLSGIVLFQLAPSAAAADSPQTLDAGFQAVFGKQGNIKTFDGKFTTFILDVLKVASAVIAVLALAAILYGAVTYILSGGDEKKTEKAKKIIIFAIVGLLILGAAGIVVNVVINIIKK